METSSSLRIGMLRTYMYTPVNFIMALDPETQMDQWSGGYDVGGWVVRTPCFSLNSLERGADMITRRTEEGAEK